MLPLDETLDTALQDHLITFIRAFGLHRPEQTPCGAPVSVAEAHALMELVQAQPLSQNALCERLNLSKSTVSRLVGIVGQRGWVERERDPIDGRAVRIRLTELGQQAAAELAMVRQEKFRRLFERIPVEERGAVIHALNILVEALRES